MHTTTLSVRRDFSFTPGPRDRNDGLFSGEAFLEDLLLPKYNEASANGSRLIVNLDGAAGYATSWLEAVFGGLVRKTGDLGAVKAIVQVESDEEPYLLVEIDEYMKDAADHLDPVAASA